MLESAADEKAGIDGGADCGLVSAVGAREVELVEEVFDVELKAEIIASLS